MLEFLKEFDLAKKDPAKYYKQLNLNLKQINDLIEINTNSLAIYWYDYETETFRSEEDKKKAGWLLNKISILKNMKQNFEKE